MILTEKLYRHLGESINPVIPVRYMEDLKHIELPFTSPQGDYFDLRTEEKNISYLASNKKNVLAADVWKKKLRITCKPGKFIESINQYLNDKVTVEKAVHLFNAKFVDSSNILVAPNNQASAIYSMEHNNNCYTLNSSCMAQKYSNCYCWRAVDGYNNMPLEILYIVENDKLSARALLWFAYLGDPFSGQAEEHEQIRVLDRVYGSEQNIAAIQNYAKERDYFVTSKNNSEAKTIIRESNMRETDLFYAKFEPVEKQRFGYMDTFRYATWYDGTIYLTPRQIDKRLSAIPKNLSSRALQTTSGTIFYLNCEYFYDLEGCEEEDFCQHGRCNNHIREGEGYMVDNGNYICRECFEAYYVKCDHCGRIVLSSESSEYKNEVLCNACLSEKFDECEICHQFFPVRELGTHNEATCCTDCREYNKVEVTA